MGSSQRLAAVAAVSHAKHYYNHTQPSVVHTESTHYNINIFFVSATLCGVLVAVCAACCRRPRSTDKPEEVTECRGIYTVSGDARLNQEFYEKRLRHTIHQRMPLLVRHIFELTRVPSTSINQPLGRYNTSEAYEPNL
ncbi:unnamed protein product [Pieris macdunnoughi]|uniref:Uncharacterized protein n=1 Tax=Pieris macdunnoughi TaxID=345717 RepID=A0A821VTJ4_9NEOP|nr:unnamed protein product [Pieris macdunnoughi]